MSRALICCVLYFSVIGVSNAFEINSFKNPADRNFINSSISEFMQKYDIPGLSIAIAKDGEFILAKGYGYASIEQNLLVTPAHQFRIASLSKPITAVAIMSLVEKSRLSLDDKVFGSNGILSIPYPRKNKLVGDITVRHLLEHTAAPEWVNENPAPMFQELQRNKRSLVKWILETRLLKNSPGSQHAYSNLGYCILGLIIEEISGQSYETYVRKNIFQQAYARSFAIAKNKKWAVPTEVLYYPHTDEDPYWFPISRMDAHGGWIANPMDVVRFVMSTDGRNKRADVLSAASIKQMTTPSELNPNYAMGWNVNKYNNWWHIGKLPGTAAILVRTNHGYSWAIMTNRTSEKESFHDDLDGLTWKLLKGVGH